MLNFTMLAVIQFLHDDNANDRYLVRMSLSLAASRSMTLLASILIKSGVQSLLSRLSIEEQQLINIPLTWFFLS